MNLSRVPLHSNDELALAGPVEKPSESHRKDGCLRKRKDIDLNKKVKIIAIIKTAIVTTRTHKEQR